MKILLAGAAGQLGNELYPLLAEIGDVAAVDIQCANSNAPGCRSVDLGDAGQLETLLNRVDPDLLINAAAFTAVDRAEEEREQAFLVNAGMPGRMARWAARNERTLLHYSTDYVFDGQAARPYREADVTSPMNAYGESKLAGELAIRASGCHALVVRTSWVYSAHGSNFVLSMLALARQRPQLRVVDDQVGCPTWARNLARASRQLIDAELHARHDFSSDTFHYCDRDAVSWYDFASLVFQTALGLGLLENAPELLKVDSSQFRQAAQRPAYSVLDTGLIQREADVRPAALAESLLSCMKKLSPDAQ